MQRYAVYFIWKLLYMFWVVPPPIIRSANNCIYSIWYLSHRYCYLPLSWKSWNWFECAVGSVRHPQHTQTGLCDGLITRPEESYRLWCVCVRSRNLVNEEAMAHWRLLHQNKKRQIAVCLYCCFWVNVIMLCQD